MAGLAMLLQDGKHIFVERGRRALPERLLRRALT
jgi:hypothetical protein